MELFWSVFSRIWTIQTKYGKIRTRITQNTDTWHLLSTQCRIYLSLRVFRIHIDWLVSFDLFKPGILFFLNPFAVGDSLLGSEYRPIFEQQCLENSKNKRFFNSVFLEGYLNKQFLDSQADRLCICGFLALGV